MNIEKKVEEIEKLKKQLAKLQNEVESFDEEKLAQAALHLYKFREFVGEMNSGMSSDIESVAACLGFVFVQNPGNDPDYWYSSSVECQHSPDLREEYPKIYEAIEKYKTQKWNGFSE